MVDPPGEGHHVSQNGLEQRFQGLAGVRRRAVKEGLGDLPGGPLPGRTLREVRPAVHDRVDHLVPGAPHFLRILQERETGARRFRGGAPHGRPAVRRFCRCSLRLCRHPLTPWLEGF